MHLELEGYDKHQAAEIECGYKDGINIDIYADVKYSCTQMREIRLGLLDGNDITQYADETYTFLQMREIRLAMQEQHDPTILADQRYSSAQMAALNLGMNLGVDVSKYADPQIPFYIMLKMKDHLIEEVNTEQSIGRITPEREAELHDLYENETNEEWTQEWRDELTAAEAQLVERWDNQYESGFRQWSQDIQVRKQQNSAPSQPPQKKSHDMER